MYCSDCYVDGTPALCLINVNNCFCIVFLFQVLLQLQSKSRFTCAVFRTFHRSSQIDILKHGGRSFATESKKSNVFKNFTRKYVEYLDKYEWKAQTLNTAVTLAIGNILSQAIVLNQHEMVEFDIAESCRYFGVGLLLIGPSMCVWYTSLDRIIKATTLRAAVSKMLMDQILFLPVFVAGLIAVMGLLCKEPMDKIKEDLNRDFKPIMIYCYMGWPWIQVLNFHFVPLQHRILVMNICSLFYNTLMSWKVEQHRHQEASMHH